jgi:hypothetical protein
MNNRSSKSATEIYLERLERAVFSLPVDVANDIVEGVREELAGVDVETAAARIAELGEPERIVAAARAEVGLPPVKTGDKPWYTVLAALLVLGGGIIVPVLGWLVGIAFVWYSKTWTLRDKLVVTLAPVVGVALTFLGSLIVQSTATVSEETANPLIPGVYNSVHALVIVLSVVLPVISGIYLLVRARSLKSPTS